MEDNDMDTQVKSNQLIISFGNEANEIEIETLLYSLLYTSSIVQETNRVIDPEKQIEIKINALAKGSFEVHIELVERMFASLFSQSSITYVAGLTTIVGGLYQLHKHLKGRKPKKVEKEGEKVCITNYEGEQTVVLEQTYYVYNRSPKVRQSAAKQFDTLSKNADVEDFTLRSERGEDVHIERDEFDTLSREIPIREEQPEPQVNILREQELLITRPSFVKELKWDFVYNGQRVSARMDEGVFRRIVEEGEQFAKGDKMLVDLEETRYWDAELGAYMITKESYKIKDYIKHIKGASDSKLFDEV